MSLNKRGLFIVAIALLIGSPTVSDADDTPLSIEGQFLQNVRQVTSGFVKAGEGYFSPDGSQIIYQAVRAEYPFYQIYTQPLGGGQPKLISSGSGRTTCAYFSPDGKRLMYSSSHKDPQLAETEAKARQEQEEMRKSGEKRRYSWPFDPWMDIYETDLNGKILSQLTSTKGYDAEGAYSADGKQIAFCSNRDGDPDIFVMNSDGTSLRQLTNSPGYDGGPFISPDGRWVVYRSDRKKEHYLQIHVVGIDGSGDVALTDSNGVNWGPYWHPTEPYIIWSGSDHSNPRARPNYDLWMMKYEVKEGKFVAGKTVRVTDHASADVLPVFSPDGKKLMWTSTRTKDGSSQLWIGDFAVPQTASQ